MSAHTFSFYCPAVGISDSLVVIDGEEHHHLSRVLRMKRGDSVRITNGSGLVVSGEIEVVASSRTTARVTGVEATCPEPAPLALALGLLPRASMETALSQCIEAGITRWIPLLAEKCHVRKSSAHTNERWTRVAVAAMKQSGRSWLPRIEAPVTVEGLVEMFGSFVHVCLADAEGRVLFPSRASQDAALAVVGPEGGFTADEIKRFVDAGAQPVALSAQRLRAETAAVTLVSILGLGRPAV